MKFNAKILIVAVAVMASLALIADAQTRYNLLAPLPTTGDNPTFAEYIPGLIQFLVLFAAVAAVVMITIGGVMYSFSEALETQKTARSMISDAIIGLIIALLSYLILRTINPDLVNLKLTIPGLQKSTGGGQTTQQQPTTNQAPSQQAQQQTNAGLSAAPAGTYKCFTYRNGELFGVTPATSQVLCEQACATARTNGLYAQCLPSPN